MTSLTEETVYTGLHYPRGLINSHSPTDPLWTTYLSQTPWNASETPWGSLTSSLTTPVLHSRIKQNTLMCYHNIKLMKLIKIPNKAALIRIVRTFKTEQRKKKTRNISKWGTVSNFRKGTDFTSPASIDRYRDRWRLLVNTVMNLRFPYNVGNFLPNSEPVSFSKRTLLHGASEWVNEWVQLLSNSVL